MTRWSGIVVGALLAGAMGAVGAMGAPGVARADIPPPPSGPMPVRPTGGAKVEPPVRFTWANATAPTGALVRYEVEVERQGEGGKAGALVAQATGGDGAAGVVIAGLPFDKPLQWRVRAVSADGSASPWSTAQTFTVVDATLDPHPAPQGCAAAAPVRATERGVGRGVALLAALVALVLLRRRRA